MRFTRQQSNNRETDEVGLYLRDLPKFRRLSREEELALTQRVDRARTDLATALFHDLNICESAIAELGKALASKHEISRCVVMPPGRKESAVRLMLAENLKSARGILQQCLQLGCEELQSSTHNPQGSFKLNLAQRKARNLGRILSECEFSIDVVRFLYSELRAQPLRGTCRGDITNGAQETTKERCDRLFAELMSARKALANANLPLVVSIAKKRQNRGIDLMDLVGAGNNGLMRAVDKFSWRTGNKFSTYATWWIEQRISREIDQTAGGYRVRAAFKNEAYAMSTAAARLSSQLGRKVNDQEVADHLQMPLPDLWRRQSVLKPTRSLAERFDDSEGAELGDILPCRGAGLDVVGLAAKREWRDILRQAIHYLPQNRWREVMSLMLLTDGNPTRNEIAGILKVTRERIRQIQNRALPKMKEILSGLVERDMTRERLDSAQRRRP